MELKENLSWEDVEFNNEAQIDYYFELLENEVNNGIFNRLEEIKEIIQYTNYTNKELIQPGYILFLKGDIYYHGEEVDINYEKAKQLYEEAIELGNSNAMNKLALILEDEVDEGDFFEYTCDKAIQLYEQAIQLGNSEAMFNLARTYEIGFGIPVNYKKAKELYEQAIEFGILKAKVNLAYMYERGKGIKQNYQKAKELYEQAIQLNNSNAMYQLALMYKYGKGVKRNYKKAIELYEQALKLGNYNAMNSLRTMYKNGETIQDKPIICLKYFMIYDDSNEIKYSLGKIKQNITYYETQLMKFQSLNYNKITFQKLKNKFI